MVVVEVDFSGKFPDAPPCYRVAVRGDSVRRVLIDAEYDVEFLRKVRKYLDKTLSVSSVAVGHISDEAIEKADRLPNYLGNRSTMTKETQIS